MKNIIITAIAALTFSHSAFGFTLRETESVKSELLQPIAPNLERIGNDTYNSYRLSGLKADETMEQVITRSIKRIVDATIRVEVSDIELLDNQNPNQLYAAASELMSSDMSLPSREEQIENLTTILMQAVAKDQNNSLKIYTATVFGEFGLDAVALFVIDTEANEIVVAVQGYGE